MEKNNGLVCKEGGWYILCGPQEIRINYVDAAGVIVGIDGTSATLAVKLPPKLPPGEGECYTLPPASRD